MELRLQLVGAAVLLLVPTVFPEPTIASGAERNAKNEAADDRKQLPANVKSQGVAVDKSAGPELGWQDFLEASRKSYEAGRLKESANELDMALAAAERLKADLNKANVFLKLGEQYLYLKQFERAKALMEEGLALKRKIPGFKSVANANALDNLAQACSRTGDLEGANKIEHEALSTYESLHKTDSHDYAIALANHANTLRLLKQYREAEQDFAGAVAIQRRLDRGDSLELAKILLNAGGMYCEMDRLDSSKRLLDHASKIIRAKLNPEHPLYKLSIKSQRVYYKKLVEALLKKNPDPIRAEVLQAIVQLAGLYDAEGDYSQASAAYKQAVGIAGNLMPPDSADLKKITQDYASCLKKLAN